MSPHIHIRRISKLAPTSLPMFDSDRLGSTRLGTVRFSSTQLGSARFGSPRIGSFLSFFLETPTLSTTPLVPPPSLFPPFMSRAIPLSLPLLHLTSSTLPSLHTFHNHTNPKSRGHNSHKVLFYLSSYLFPSLILSLLTHSFHSVLSHVPYSVRIYTKYNTTTTLLLHT